ncbi:hypothetical protein N665_0227s0064 [Sinapis alba]|nr:hypothetical protein N665_0227s0064 [Sinapis alba]
MEMTSGVEDDKNRSVLPENHHQQPPAGYPQPAQPYVSGYAVNGLTEQERLPCCGIGIGWLLFILGFFLGSIPWYIGFFLLLCSRDPREKPGYIACTIGAVITTGFVVFGAIRGSGIW